MQNAVILNSGAGAWAFEPLATRLSNIFEVPISSTPATFNYVLAFDGKLEDEQQSFIPLNAINIATDKRETAAAFNNASVPSPTTYLFDDNHSSLKGFLDNHRSQTWLLKWPVGCGAAGHRFIEAGDNIPDDWPRPLVIQEFIPQVRPEVFRIYCVERELFGFNARRFADDNDSPFVAHARGAHYETEVAPPEAEAVARLALKATHLWDSFGCVDLLRSQNGDWLALEVNTDGLWMHVDRDVPSLIGNEIEERLTGAFRNFIQHV
jgi:glutathione synthase/RimK-type ligase-like ATP-grasp enzyme